MARFKHYARALASSYFALAANVAYTLASVPLALSFLSKDEFGLWALSTQLAGFIALLDLGMGGAASRILVDFKDRQHESDYGSTILTGFLVNVAQGVLIALVGVVLAGVVGPWLAVPSELLEQFRWLVVGQAVLMGGGLALRMAYMVLTAHQRSDLANLANAVLFVVSFGVLWWSFSAGAGVFSMLWAAVAGQGLAALIAVTACVRLRLLPRRGLWGRPSWQRFRELFAFGRDMLLYSVGGQLVNASQAILLTHVLGLQKAADWSVCTRVFTLIAQVIYRIFDSACAALAEMIVRQERQRLMLRFKSMMVLIGSLSVLAGVGLAMGNQPFTELWTGGRIGWSQWNDCLLALWLPLLALMRGHTGLVGLTKEFRFLRYVYFLEGFFFVSLAIGALRVGGVPAMLVVSVVASLLFSLPYGIRRVGGYFGLRWQEVAFHWMRPTLRLALLFVPMAVLVNWSVLPLPAWARLLVSGVVVGVLGGLLLLRFGIDEPMRRELSARIPGRLAGLRGLWEPSPKRTG